MTWYYPSSWTTTNSAGMVTSTAFTWSASASTSLPPLRLPVVDAMIENEKNRPMDVEDD